MRSTFSLMFPLLLLLLLVMMTSTTKVDVDLINETIRSLLHFQTNFEESNSSAPILRRPSSPLSSYMKKLYQIYRSDDVNDDGNLIRGIEPAVGKFDGADVLVFNIADFDGNESIMRAELHFFLRRRDILARRRARQIHAKSVCLNEYCREQTLRKIRDLNDDQDEFKVVWDATKPVFDSYHLDGKQIVFKISRDHQKMRPYSELIRKSSPFLIVYSQVNHTLDTATVIQATEQKRRMRRDVVNRKYYSYTSIPLENDAGDGGEGVSKASKSFSNSEEASSEDVWRGFGEDTSREERERKENEKMENDVRVILLQNRNRCHKEGTMINLNHFGWDKWIIEPKTIEASFCKGKCSKPLTMASNHAQLQTIFANEPVCCAPSNLKSLNLLYRDEKSRMVIRNYQKMLIGSCSCL